MPRSTQFSLLAGFQKNLRKLKYTEKVPGDPRFTWLSQKNDFVFLDQICSYKALNQYSMALVDQFTPLTVLQTNL